MELPSWKCLGVLKDGPLIGREMFERLLPAGRFAAFSSDVANEYVDDLIRVIAGQLAVDFRILFTGISHQEESALGIAGEQRLNATDLVVVGIA